MEWMIWMGWVLIPCQRRLLRASQILWSVVKLQRRDWTLSTSFLSHKWQKRITCWVMESPCPCKNRKLKGEANQMALAKWQCIKRWSMDSSWSSQNTQRVLTSRWCFWRTSPVGIASLMNFQMKSRILCGNCT